MSLLCLFYVSFMSLQTGLAVQQRLAQAGGVVVMVSGLSPVPRLRFMSVTEHRTLAKRVSVAVSYLLSGLTALRT